MYSNLEELKQAFYTDSSISSRELLWSMEEILLGTSELKRHWADQIIHDKSINTNDDLFRKLILNAPYVPFEERYPVLSTKVDVVDYDNQEPQEWDIAFHERPSGVRLPALYVHLDGEFKRRCEHSEDIVVISGLDAERSNKGYRLKDV